MSRKSTKSAKRPRGTPGWILAEFQSLGAGARLSTSQIAKRISKARGKKYHRNSIYNALRLLTRRGDVQMTKSGREKIYLLGSGSGVRAPRSEPSPAAVQVETLSAEVQTMPSDGTLGHKLALDEILVLRSTDRHVVSATNKRGRLVLKKHPLPK
ncbi:MAG TPA: hypothetical protein VGS23_03935 [Thermoplasmata archaeon]|nr:hypothetical protein [Thermoplasmata archaeon]